MGKRQCGWTIIHIMWHQLEVMMLKNNYYAQNLFCNFHQILNFLKFWFDTKFICRTVIKLDTLRCQGIFKKFSKTDPRSKLHVNYTCHQHLITVCHIRKVTVQPENSAVVLLLNAELRFFCSYTVIQHIIITQYLHLLHIKLWILFGET